MADKPTGDELLQIWTWWDHAWGIITGFSAAVIAVIVATRKIWDYQKTTENNHNLLVGVVSALSQKFHDSMDHVQRVYNEQLEQNKENDRRVQEFRTEMRDRMSRNEQVLSQMQVTVAKLERTNERILDKLDMV